MKFKQSQQQNQRIERITTNHLVVGIDVAKEVHVARAVNFRGLELGKHCTFSNDVDGFQRLHKWITNLKERHNLTAVLIGLEPTGHYWLNLAAWLFEEKFEVVLVNPYHVKKTKEYRDNSPTKHDVKDALLIADHVKNGYYSPVRIRSREYQALQVLMNHWEAVSKQFVSIKNQIHGWLDKWFPEYHQVFKDWSCKTSLVTLQLFPLPSDIKQLTAEEIYEHWKPYMKRRGSIHFAHALIEQSHRSVGATIGQEQARRTIAWLLKQYELLSAELKEIEADALKLLEQIPLAKNLQTVPGLGNVAIAQILAITGDLSGFDHGRQVLRLAGLHLGEQSSGKHKGEIKITKRGSSALRKILFLAVISLVKNNEEFRALHQYNVQVKKMKKICSILKLCGKLARILVGIARNNSSYTAIKVQALSPAA